MFIKNIKSLLKKVHEKYPTESMIKHNLTLGDNGVTLTIFVKDKWQQVYIDSFNEDEQSIDEMLEGVFIEIDKIYFPK